MFRGVSNNELVLVALLLVIVMLAPKVPKIGEAIGAWFERRGADEAGPPGASDAANERRTDGNPPNS